jgi:hypothetical protein
MAERVNLIRVKDGNTSIYSERWGGCDVWVYGLQPPDTLLENFPTNVEANSLPQAATSGALLINEDVKTLVFSLSCQYICDEPYPSYEYFDEIALPDDERARKAYLDLVQQIWMDWKAKFANSCNFSIQGKIVTNVYEIPEYVYDNYENMRRTCNLSTREIYFRISEMFLQYHRLPFENL